MTVLLAGHRVGHLRIDRTREGGTITTAQDFVIQLDREGKRIPMSVFTRSVETADGQPLAFYSRSSLSSSDSTVDGRRAPDGSYEVTNTVAGASRHTTFTWPAGAVLSEGQRLAMLKAASHPGEHYLLSMFDPASQVVSDLDMEVLGDERVALPDGPMLLDHQREVMQSSRGAQTMDVWLDPQGDVRKSTLIMLGQPLEMLACSEACATASVQGVDVLHVALIDSPRPITPDQRDTILRYRIHVPEGAPQPAIATDEQRVTSLGHGDWMIDIGPAQAGGESPPSPEDSLPNAWVQSDAPLIRRMASHAVGGARDDLQKMHRLRTYVSQYVKPHGLDVGYASALEVARSREGDCTEYAVLLAALARAQGIPARVVTGMVYVPHYADSSNVFVPHAWMQAWVQGRWQSFDAALLRFDSTHIALDVGDGDPWHFFNISDLLGRMRIDEVSSPPLLAGHLQPPSDAPAVGLTR
jgi:transglutaminase-like putative cysteine protease